MKNEENNNKNNLNSKYEQLISNEEKANDGVAETEYQCNFGCSFEQKTQKDIENAQKARKKLLFASVFCIIFMIAELFGGYIAHSVALMSDALHLLSDFGGFLISVVALIMAQKDPTNKLSFGYHRAEIIGALFSVFLIWILTIWLVYEAIYRLFNPEHVDGEIMFIVACCGIVVNIIMGFILHGGGGEHSHDHKHEENEQQQQHEQHEEHKEHEDTNTDSQINVRSALIHVLGDLVQSIGVLVAAALIWYDNKTFRVADPICTLIFSVIVIFTTYKLMRDILSVLMESVPSNLDFDEIKRELFELTNVTQVHDLHIWNLSMGKPTLSVHLLVKPTQKNYHGIDAKTIVMCTDQILRKAQNILSDKFKIYHSTVQIEWPHDHNQISQHQIDEQHPIDEEHQNILNIN